MRYYSGSIVLVKSVAANCKKVKLAVRGQDNWKQRTNVYLDGRVVMTAKLTSLLSSYVPGMRCEWDVDVAAGMDMCLASVLVVLLAANMYDSGMPTSTPS